MNNSAQFTAPQRFEAASSREALRLAREQLGPDAMVLSSQVTATGVAIVAVAEMPALPSLPAAPVTANTDSVLREIHAMRGMIEEQLASLVQHEAGRQTPQASDPLRSQMLRVMLGAGLSPRLARSTLARWPAANPTGTAKLADAMAWLKTTLASQLPVLGDEESLMAAGGVYALVGPTGVGKTTTTAKLAARCVMRFGAQHLALVTTDTFRIGAVEQLRIYGEILGVPVYAVQSGAELDGLLTQLQGKHMVLIDTVGMSQRDRAVADQLALLSAPQRPVKRLLLLNAASQGDTLDEVVRAYQSVGTPGADGQPGAALAGCIFTKVDEAAHSGALIDIAIREQLRVHYVANGQQVPANLILAGAEALVDSVLAVRAPSAWIDTEPALARIAQEAPALKEAMEVPAERKVAAPLQVEKAEKAEKAAPAEMASAQAGRLLRALAHDSRALARTAAQLGAAPIGYAATRALWHALTQGQVDSSDADTQAAMAPEVQSAGWLLALTGKSQFEGDGHAAFTAHSTLMLSAQDGTPVLAPTSWSPVTPDGIQTLEDSSTPATSLHGQPVVHVLAQSPRSEQVLAWAQAGVRWVAQGSAGVRVEGRAPTLAHLLKTASFGHAEVVTFRRKPARLSLAEVEIGLLDADAPVMKAGANQAAPRVRCIIKRISDVQGKALSHSFVLCPLALDVPAAQLVQWPVWRTEVEPYFKLLTQALAQPLAHSADRALQWRMAAQACSTVYRLQRLDVEEAGWADAARKLLAQFAGRPVRPSQPITGPTLLDGLGKFMALLDALQSEPAAEPDEVLEHDAVNLDTAVFAQMAARASSNLALHASHARYA